jgi:hypothetical protein
MNAAPAPYTVTNRGGACWHQPGQPVIVESSTPSAARAVVTCRRCGAYVASFEGTLPAVQRATHFSA